MTLSDKLTQIREALKDMPLVVWKHGDLWCERKTFEDLLTALEIALSVIEHHAQDKYSSKITNVDMKNGSITVGGSELVWDSDTEMAKEALTKIQEAMGVKDE